MYNPGNAIFTSNLFAKNGGPGLNIYQGNAAPIVRNNIFSDNNHGLYIGRNDGWGGATCTPSEVKYNAFFNNTYGHIVHGSLPPQYTFRSEVPGEWGEMNQHSWTEGNISMEPRFVDADNFDFRLASDSFLIDEGDPADAYGNEPALNSARINIGPNGDTSSAQTSGSSVAVTNVSAQQSGDAITITFDTSANSAYLWITLSYWDGDSYKVIPAASFSGDDYVVCLTIEDQDANQSEEGCAVLKVKRPKTRRLRHPNN